MAMFLFSREKHSMGSQRKAHHFSGTSFRGMSLIDVLVGTFIMLVVFLGIFAAFQLSIEIVFSSKAKNGAVALLTQHMESIRSRSYNNIGTVGGIPAGNIPQVQQDTLNGITYTINTLIQYEDAPDDGLDELDENGITADYKLVKVEIFWDIKGSSRSTFAVTRVAPVGEESLTGGGTLRVNVIDAGAQPIADVDVRVVNNTTVPTIDTTVQTNTSGRASFPGSPEASGYELTVTKDGYSTYQTYDVTVGNPNPSPGHISVQESVTTTIAPQIDVLGEIRTTTWEPQGAGSFTDTFTSATNLTGITNVEVVSGELVLEDIGGGVYADNGSAFSISVAPSFLDSWNEITYASTTPASGSLLIRLYYFDGSVYTLVPDTDLANNSAGFTESPIDISALDTATYTDLQLGAFLSTTDTSETPELLDWTLSYVAGPTPLPGVDFDIRGEKTIGSDGGGLPIYKFEDSVTSTAFGEWNFADMEWDTYIVSLPGSSPYDVAERCPNVIELTPAETLDLALWLAPDTARSLRVIVESNDTPIAGAQVSITGPESDTKTATNCGQVFFSDLTSGTYTVSVTATGYQAHNEDVDVTDDAELPISLTAN